MTRIAHRLAIATLLIGPNVAALAVDAPARIKQAGKLVIATQPTRRFPIRIRRPTS